MSPLTSLEPTPAGAASVAPLDELLSPEARASIDALAVAGEDLPQPYRDLLAHQRDMTSTLERHHGEPIVLDVLATRVDGDVLLRRVVLIGERSGRPVELGAIRIFLDRLPPAPRQEVVAGERPLGAILGAHELPYTSRPKGFFSLAAEGRLASALAAPAGVVLYGRRNVLATPEGTLAEVVEILPPWT